MLRLKKIAVTGGLASGKSTVCRLLEKHGAYILSADDIVHELLSPRTRLGKRVIDLIGSDCVVGDLFDRHAIAKKVFNDQTLLVRLEQLLHPEVQKVIEAEYARISSMERFSLFVVEIPLLFEKGWHLFYDATIAVIADRTLCYERFKKKGYSENEYELRERNLLRMEEKAMKADFTVTNNENLESLEQALEKIYKQLTRI